MRTFLLFLVLFPFFCLAQHQPESEPGSAAITTCWRPLVRPTLSNPLTTYYRFLYQDGEYKLELKLSAGGVPFIVVQGAKLEMEMENGDVVVLYNERWQHSCKGCGSRGANANIPGVTLSFKADKNDIAAFCSSYLGHIRLYLVDNTLGSHLTLERTETFREEAEEFRYRVTNTL